MNLKDETMTETMKYDFDLAVVGGGPAGASSAYHAAKLGLRTILFEKRAYPRDKLCGGALSGRCLPLLGSRARNAINCEVEGLRIFSPSFESFTSKSKEVSGYFVLREEFDEAIARDAEDTGARLMDNCPVKILRPLSTGGYEIAAGNGGGSMKVTARFVILATGLQDNSLGKQLGTGITENNEKDYLAMCVMSETPIDNKILDNGTFSGKLLGIFLGVVPNGYGWCFVKDGHINIGIGATALLLKDVGPKRAYRTFVKLLREREVLPGDLELVNERPFPLPFKRTAAQTVFGNALLVGDSSGFVSPVTGEGLYYAIKGGQLAAEAILQNIKNGSSLSLYQENWKKTFGNDINKRGYLLRETLYKSRKRMEFAVALCRHDRKMALMFNKMIYGVYGYGETIRKVLLRLPVSLLKVVF